MLIKKRLMISLIILIFFITIYLIKLNHQNNLLIGGNLLEVFNENNTYTNSNIDEDYNEQYHRPSKNKAIDNKYDLTSFTSGTAKITSSEEVVYAYYGILEEAANMEGGCGSIGNVKTPYHYAYNLLSSNYKNKITEKQFEDSFKGIGHIAFLKIYKLSETSYFIEIEVITGQQDNKNKEYKGEINYFSYYYGIVSTINENNEWKIDNINYYPEEFLCAPYHNWFYDGKAVVEIIYNENLKIIEKINDYNISNNVINIYAAKGSNKYRFDFIKLTNGHDILIGESIMRNGVYIQTDLLTDQWQYLKLKK